ncbi:MAG: zinc-ribbon domain-containing protein [Verrucomicrobia bacterium]|nr:zinc-ribbon domain-containing protein [Verrucomicrobiota bacterium]
MDIKISCPNCDQHIAVDSTAIGQQAVCPTCSTPFTIKTVPSVVSPNPPPPPTHKGRLALWLAVAGAACVITAAVGIWSYSGSKNRQASPTAPVAAKADASAVPLLSSNDADTNKPRVIASASEASVRTGSVTAIASGDEWQTNMSIFAKKVLDMAKRSTTPLEDKLRSGLRPFLPVGASVLFNNEKEVGVMLHGKMDGEYGAELLKHFRTGTVSWEGPVWSAKIDDDQKSHFIEIEFPTHSGSVQLQPLKLKIPFSKLPPDRSPAKGDIFAFNGVLKGNKEDPLCEEAVEVIYWLAASEERGKQWVTVSLADVAPEKPTTLKSAKATSEDWRTSLPSWIATIQLNLSMSVEGEVSELNGAAAEFAVTGSLTNRGQHEFKSKGPGTIFIRTRAESLFDGKPFEYPLNRPKIPDGQLTASMSLKGSVYFGLRGEGTQLNPIHPEIELHFNQKGDRGDVILMGETKLLACASGVLSYTDGGMTRRFVVITD